MLLIDPFPLITDLIEMIYTDDDPSMVLTKAGEQIWNAAIECVTSKVKEQPVIDSEPVRHGRWEWYEDWGPSTWLEPPDLINAGWKCSNCGIDLGDYLTDCLGVNVYVDEEDKMPKTKSCPHCGAKMDAKEAST